jgi:uracil phosphoribosyltransferase
MVAAFKALKPFGVPKEIHLVSIIGATEGVAFIQDYFDDKSHLWIAAIDEHLNDKSYIVPGLGDAGDLAFGEKLQH